MALINCPECKKEVSDKAAVCIHCGFPIQPEEVQTKQLDNSNIQRFKGYLKDNSRNLLKPVVFYGHNKKLAISDLLRKNRGWSLSPQHEIEPAPMAAGKYSCPNCKAKFTNCERKIGCAIMIIIFVSLGLGLIMIPFLPHHCECLVCGHRWKS